ncbi:MAG: Rieske 2Fe-2S domain-containing protein [Verrucomicrobiota bacterium]
MSEPSNATDKTDRRSFMAKALSVVIGGIVTIIPAAAGLGVLLDPLRRKSAGGAVTRVTTLDALPDDGEPRKFAILAERVDAWNKFPATPVGAVYLRRVGNTVQALNVVCPHAGCFVDYVGDKKEFLCPCHNSTFALDGAVGTNSPSPRGMDTLEVEIKNQKEVWVKFQNFQAGHAEKIPVA